MLFWGPGLPASPATVAKALHDTSYITEEQPTRHHPDHVRSFERAKPQKYYCKSPGGQNWPEPGAFELMGAVVGGTIIVKGQSHFAYSLDI
jgi:hypothetical protein